MDRMKRFCQIAVLFLLTSVFCNSLKAQDFAIKSNLLYDATASAQQLMQVSEVLRKEGSVLAAAALPESVHWRRLMKLVEGEAICIESNG